MADAASPPAFFNRHKPLPDLAAAVNILVNGGIVLYPTETYYAIGCSAFNCPAVEAVFAVKDRPMDKPAPIVAATRPQAAFAADLACAPQKLLDSFWPGPLTILLPARHGIPKLLQDSMGRCAIRVSSHPLANRLAQLTKLPLVATSANLSGERPARNMSDISRTLLTRLEAQGKPWGLVPRHSLEKSAATAPSTVVEAIEADGSWVIHILRAGCIDKTALQNHNFTVVDK